ncbi:hypothetical protein OAS39_02880 [Pirellulales bacterium]|nr:hypothetical protein [Pirellulales bacterium]MDC0935204.1 hypothetical protein [Pirellulales bacterium]
MRVTCIASPSMILFALLALPAGPLAAAPVAMIVVEPNPSVSVGLGQTAEFDLYLRNYQPDNAGDAIISFGLNVAASDSALTGNGSDFSRFSFTLDAGLGGILGGIVFDGDISDEGRAEFGADAPNESGILESMGDTLLGSLSIAAPDMSGVFPVDLQFDPSSPILVGGTFFLVDDGSTFGQTIPGDGDLTITPSTIVVVPEPSAVAQGLAMLTGLALCRCRTKTFAWVYRDIE